MQKIITTSYEERLNLELHLRDIGYEEALSINCDENDKEDRVDEFWIIDFNLN